MEPEQPPVPGYMKTLRQHWRLFILSWIAPIAAMIGVLLFGPLGVMVFPVFLGVGMTPFYLRQTGFWQTSFWAVKVTFVFWGALMLLSSRCR